MNRLLQLLRLCFTTFAVDSDAEVPPWIAIGPVRRTSEPGRPVAGISVTIGSRGYAVHLPS